MTNKPLVEIRYITRDEQPQAQGKCPDCGKWEDLDADQLARKVSCICEECGWHGFVQ